MVKIVLFEIVVLAFIGIASGALNSQDSLEEFRLHPDCQMELVATEPAVVDPIAMRFDEFGRMWVVEMRDYPTLQGGQPDSQIKIIEDKDGDGIYESATVFANHLMFPTGIQPWKKGVIVTLAGKVLFLADLDGDGVCDQEKTLFTGFAEQNTQLRANHPTMGPDGLIYVANGLRNGSITGGKITTSLSINGMDFRLNPSTLVAESVTGYGQFGLTFDDAGIDNLYDDDLAAADLSYSTTVGSVALSIASDVTAGSANANSFSASTTQSGMAFTLTGSETAAGTSASLAMSYALNDTVTITADTDQVAGAESVQTIGAATTLNGVSVSVESANNSTWDVDLGYTAGGFALTYGVDETDGWTATATSALGGGATFAAGVNSEDSMYAGVSFAF